MTFFREEVKNSSSRLMNRRNLGGKQRRMRGAANARCSGRMMLPWRFFGWASDVFAIERVRGLLYHLGPTGENLCAHRLLSYSFASFVSYPQAVQPGVGDIHGTRWALSMSKAIGPPYTIRFQTIIWEQRSKAFALANLPLHSICLSVTDSIRTHVAAVRSSLTLKPQIWPCVCVLPAGKTG